MVHPTRDSTDLEQRLELVVKTGLKLTNSFDLEGIVQSATDAGLQLCGAQFGAFFYNVLDESGESYLLYTLSGVSRERFANFPMPRNTGLFAPTFEGTAVVRSDDITKDPRYGQSTPYHGMPEGHLPVRSYLAVPVKSQSGEVLGGLFYGHERVGVFEESSEMLVSALASQAAVAIDNARLRDEMVSKIAELQRAQASLKENAKRLGELAAIVESSDDAIISKDLNGVISSWNRAATRILGYSADEMIGQSILKLIPEELHGDEPVILGKMRAGERIEHFETVRVTKDGRRLDVSLTVSPVRDDTGTIVGASKILRDVSSRKKLERSLVQAEKIAATGRMAATIAHEINNPLEAIVNLLFLIRPTITDQQGLTYLSAAESELDRVSNIAKQTLGYYRENASAVRMTVNELAKSTALIYGPRCERAGIMLELQLESTRELSIRRGEMMQVISNLVTNSIYAMPNGGTLRIRTADLDTPRSGVVVVVEDTGKGIPAEEMLHIFEAFFTTRTTIGTGIGLFIAKQFIEGHGGTIAAKSSTSPENHGTVMTIFLPKETKYSE